MKRRVIRNIAIGILLFMALGRGIVLTGTMLIPAEFYYEIESPIKVEYEKENNVLVLDFHRRARIETDSITAIEVTLCKDGVDYEEAFSVYKRTFEARGDKDVKKRFSLSFPLDEGVYQVRGVVRFNVNGVDKVEHFNSNEFVVEGKVNTDGTR